MKVVFLTRRYYPHVGGVEKHISRITRELISRGWNVEIITENHDQDAPKYTTSNVENARVHYLTFGPDGWFKKFRIWRSMISRKDLFEDADIIHIHDIVFWYLPLLLLVRKPIYATFHGDEKVYPIAKSAIFIRRLSEFVSKRSIDVGAYLAKWYGTRPDTTIHGAVEKAYAISGHQKNANNLHISGKRRPDITKKTHPTHTKTHLLLLGRLDPDISIHLYTDIFKNLTSRGFEYTLDVCGDGSEKRSLQKFGKVHGFVRDVDPYVKKADIVCASSYLAILEALSMYKPVVAVYENPMKKDYLSLAPFSKWICITDKQHTAVKYIERIARTGYSESQRKEIRDYIMSITWKHITDQYEELWQVS